MIFAKFYYSIPPFVLTDRLERGTYYLFIDDVQLADHIFIESRGLSHGSIMVK